MILPIVAYGHPVLKQVASPVAAPHPDLDTLIAAMFETMYNANGVGLAAPQVNQSLRLFIADGTSMQQRDDVREDMTGFRKVFLNPEILTEEGDPWGFDEGCLSIPGLRETVHRPAQLTIRYFDEQWQEHTDTFAGVRARIIQHEFDHIEGVLFTEYASALRKQLMRGKLQKIMRGEVTVDYPMLFYNRQRAGAR